MENKQFDSTDERWGEYIPWFLRHQGFSGSGNFLVFFERLSQRLTLFFDHESGIPNMHYFIAKLESESLQQFRQKNTESYEKNVNHQIPWYFNPDTLNMAIRQRIHAEIKAPTLSVQFQRAQTIINDPTSLLYRTHYINVVIERLAVLESLLRILPKEKQLKLILDIRKFFVASQIMLDIKGDPPLIETMEEPLLQKEVVDELLPRLTARFPDRAKEIVKAYHNVIAGTNLDSIFSEVFKTLEEIGRSITEDKSFMFDKIHLKKHFPKLHPTIHETMVRLAGHRGDKGGHARSAPELHEIRYLLFSVCNLALLLLDYPFKSKNKLEEPEN